MEKIDKQEGTIGVNSADHKRKLSEGAQLLQLEATATNPIPKFMYNMTEGMMDTLTFGKFTEGADTTTPYYDEIHSGTSAKIGNIVGTGVGIVADGVIGAGIAKIAGNVIKGAQVVGKNNDIKEIYRAVSPEELDDVFKTGGFRQKPDDALSKLKSLQITLKKLLILQTNQLIVIKRQ